MSQPFLIGVDLGTTGTKAAIFDSGGQLVASAYEESILHYPRPGWVEQDRMTCTVLLCVPSRSVSKRAAFLLRMWPQ